MRNQMTGRQGASKEVIKGWMNLYVRLFSSTDIYRNICFTPAVGKALCLVRPLQPMSKNIHVGHMASQCLKETKPYLELQLALVPPLPSDLKDWEHNRNGRPWQPYSFYTRRGEPQTNQRLFYGFLTVGFLGLPGCPVPISEFSRLFLSVLQIIS